MPTSPAIKFEYAMRQWFGDRAFGIAGMWDSASGRNRWLHKWVKAITKEVTDLDTDEKHRDRILHEIDSFSSTISKADNPSWNQIFILLDLIGALLGRLYIGGYRSRNLFYVLEAYQNYRDTNPLPAPLQEIQDSPTIVQLRYDIVLQMRERGIPDWRIAQVLNTSVYHLKRLDSSLPKQA